MTALGRCVQPRRVRCSHLLCVAQYVAAVTGDALKVNPVLGEVGHARALLQFADVQRYVIL